MVPQNTRVNSFTYFQTSLHKYSFVPTYQNFAKHPEEEGIYEKTILILTGLAEKGRLLIKFEDLCDLVAESTDLRMDASGRHLKLAEKIGLIHITKRQFNDIKTVVFVSLRLDNISLESLLWTLRSLKVDEMIPTERAI